MPWPLDSPALFGGARKGMALARRPCECGVRGCCLRKGSPRRICQASGAARGILGSHLVVRMMRLARWTGRTRGVDDAGIYCDFTADDPAAWWGAAVSEATIYTWNSKYQGRDVNEAQRLKTLADEDRRLKQLVADLSLDKEALKSIVRKNGGNLPARRLARPSIGAPVPCPPLWNLLSWTGSIANTGVDFSIREA